MQILVATLALTITFVCGNNDENPLKDIVGYRQWKPLIKWRQQPYSHSTVDEANDYPNALSGYDDTDSMGTAQDLQAIDFKSKRSRFRQTLCEVLVNIVTVGNGTDGYQYRPDHYVTESCLNSFNTFQNKVRTHKIPKHNMCIY